MKNLEVHQLNGKSRLGDDCLENLITLCNACHRIGKQGYSRSGHSIFRIK